MSSAMRRIGKAGSGRTAGRWFLMPAARVRRPAVAPRVGAPGFRRSAPAARSAPGAAARRGPPPRRSASRAAGPRPRGRSRSPWSAPISSSADPVRGQRPRQEVQQPPDDVQAVRPAVQRGARLEGEVPCQPGEVARSRRTAGWRRSPRTAAWTRSGSRSPTVNVIRSATPWLTAFSRASCSASPDRSLASTRTWLRHLAPAEGREQRDGDRARARADIRDPQRWRAHVARYGGQPRAHRLERRIHEELGLGARDQGAIVGADRQPVELPEAAQVGHRLALLPPDDERLERRPGPVAHERFRVREDPGPVRAQGPGQQQLRVQARRPGARGGETVGGGRHQGRDDGRGLGHRGYPPISVRSWRRSAWSAIWRASISASICPSSTPGTLWIVTPIRWSVTRLSGKL